MYIKEVKVKNYRAFANEVNLNLKPNINKIEEDVETNNFKKIDNSEYFCPLASIGSANAKGKTSLLYSIADFFNMFSLLNYKTLINDEYKQQQSFSSRYYWQKVKREDYWKIFIYN